MSTDERISKIERAVEVGQRCEGCRQLVVAVAAFRVYGVRGGLPEPDSDGSVPCEGCGAKFPLEPTPAEHAAACRLADDVYGVNRSDRFGSADEDFGDVT